jgi:uncharacterized protein with GYD domain
VGLLQKIYSVKRMGEQVMKILVYHLVKRLGEQVIQTMRHQTVRRSGEQVSRSVRLHGVRVGYSLVRRLGILCATYCCETDDDTNLVKVLTYIASF